MNILVTGANGYIGQRLIPALLMDGHELFCAVRNKSRFERTHTHDRIHTIELDFLDDATFTPLPAELDVAYYLIHSMSGSIGGFEEQESQAARNFLKLVGATSCRQIIYLGGIANAEVLSEHLTSRSRVEAILRSGPVPVTVLRAGIVVGSGSASFEIMRDLVEKLPVMVAPRWLNTQCQPIAVRNVVEFLTGVVLRESTYNRDFDIAGPDVLTYKQMLLQFAEVRVLKRWILIVPVMTPRLSSYWLYFVTQTPYPLAVNLVESMKVNVIARPNGLATDLCIGMLTYNEAVRLSMETTADDVPEFGCFREIRERAVRGDAAKVWERVWSIGGKRGWYYANFLWKLRGLMDKAVGGVGLNRGRVSATGLKPGDVLDFWRVLVADKQERRLLLFAEMKLPGEAWLEFRMSGDGAGEQLVQSATFRPRGLLGRLYWYGALPFHRVIFSGMIDAIAMRGRHHDQCGVEGKGPQR